MATAQSPGTGIAFGIAQPRRLRKIARTHAVLTRYAEQNRLLKTDIPHDNYRELMLLDEFLTNHIQQDGLCNVQCMLLWTEWVRIFLRHTHRFPVMILEDELRQAITNHLGIEIADDDTRGPVYPGIRFVP